MTTGTKGSLADPQNYSFHSWSGVDGKYEVVNGVRRCKFNNFTSTKAVLSTGAYHMWYLGDWNITGWPNWTMGTQGFNLNDTVKLQSKLASKVRSTDLHLGKNVAEGRQFVGMVRKTLFTVAKTIVSIKRGDPQLAISHLIDGHRAGKSYRNYEVVQLLKKHKIRARDAAGMWLELQYGWLPLLKDVQAATDLFASQMEGERKTVIKVSATRTVHFEASASPTLYQLKGFANFVQKLSYEFAESDNVSLQRAVGLEDPAGIVWEVVPFSFVVDWFMPIGSYLESLNVLPLLKGRWCLTKVISAHAGQLSGKNISRSIDFTGCYLEGTSINVERTHGEGFSFFNIAPPDIRPLSDVFSPKHIYNAAALATQMISGGNVSRK